MREPADRPLTPRERSTFAGTLCLVMLAVASVALTTSCVKSASASVSQVPPTTRDSSGEIDPIVADEYARIVQIDVICPDLHGQGGSGVRAGGNMVLTASHVMNCGGVPPLATTVTTRDGTEYNSISISGKNDDAMRLTVIGLPPMPALKVAQAVVGQRACAAFAYPMLGRRCGDVWMYVEPEESLGIDLRVDLVAEHGNSGSAVYDPQGNLIGILSALWHCPGTAVPQVCTAGVTSLWRRRSLLTAH